MKKLLVILLCAICVVLFSGCDEDPFWFLREEEEITYVSPVKAEVNYWTVEETEMNTHSFSGKVSNIKTNGSFCSAKLVVTDQNIFEIHIRVDESIYNIDTENNWRVKITNITKEDPGTVVYDCICTFSDNKFIIDNPKSASDLISIFSKGGDFNFNIENNYYEYSEVRKGQANTEYDFKYHLSGFSSSLDSLNKGDS